MVDYEEMAQEVTEGNAERTKELAEKALEEGMDLKKVIKKGFTKGMERAGEKFEKDEYYVPDLLRCVRALNNALDVLLPEVEVEEEEKADAKILLATVNGDIHDVGKTLVKTFLETAGFDVIDIGEDKSEDEIAEAVREEEPDIVGLSSLLTFTMEEIGTVADKLEEEGLRDKVRLIVGGAPISESFADRMGADYYAEDSSEAVKIVKKIVQERKK